MRGTRIRFFDSFIYMHCILAPLSSTSALLDYNKCHEWNDCLRYDTAIITFYTCVSHFLMRIPYDGRLI